MNVQIQIERKADEGTNPHGFEPRGSMEVAAPRVLIVGRHIDCDLRLDSDDVSRQHARVILAEDNFGVEDLSSNGTAIIPPPATGAVGDVLRKARAFFPYGTQLEVGPFRITVGREGIVRVSAYPGPVAAPGTPAINAPGAMTPSRGVPTLLSNSGALGQQGAQPTTNGLGTARAPRTPVPSYSQPVVVQPHGVSPRPPSQPVLAQVQAQAQAQARTGAHPTLGPLTGPVQAVTGPVPAPTGPIPAITGPVPVVSTGREPSASRATALPPPVDRSHELAHSEELLALRRRVHGELLKNLDFAKIDPNVNDPSLRPRVLTALKRIVSTETSPVLARIDRDAFIGELLDEALGLGPLEPLLADASVTEIMVVDPATIYVERGGRLELTPTRFTDEERVRAVIERIVTPLGRRIDESQPLVDARLPDGSRVNAIIRPLALRGSCITIRRFPKRRLTVDDFLRLGSLTPRVAKFLERAVVAKKNVLISGGTGSGKTTLLNVLSAAIPSVERIVTIEDAAELQLHQPHVVSLETKHANMEGKGAFTIRDLVKNALRMRPDRIVVGECRGGEALDMLQAMNTGHDGSLTTIHANSPIEALSRLETLVLMAGVDLPSHAIREQIARSIHVIVQQTRLSDGSRKITHVSEIDELDPSGRFEVRPIFEFEQTGVTNEGKVIGDLEATGYLPSFLDEMLSRGLIRPGEAFL